ncbi:MAG: hypothetical protein GX589_03670 [Deltaproteobacteria bacterium]|nr:hypothetical protein [Deltaproteobacteria bacterium]
MIKTKFKKRRYKGYRIGSSRDLTDSEVESLVQAITAPPDNESEVLGGRGFITSTQVSGLGPVVLKHYRRGGVFRFFGANRYLHLGGLRPRQEYEVLNWVRALGVSAPEPLAFIVKGGLFYRGWLVTQEIPDEESLARISLREEARAFSLIKKLTNQISVLIENGVYHVDLHPGNVLVDKSERIFLLDFDKARIWRGRKNKLRDLYICRWRRAVIKHGLPEGLSEWLCAELRRSYD